MKINNVKKALIYCRVSSDRQVKEGHGLDSQELICRQYALSNGYELMKIFKEEGVSGALPLMERPQMRLLVQYLDQYPTEKFVVIFDDLKRFARDVEVHFKIKAELFGRGAQVECPNFNFDDSPEGKFVETIIAASAELERNQNSRQVVHKQKARLEKGYWTFCPPITFKYYKDSTHGKILIPREPYATIHRNAIEQYVQRLLKTKVDVRNYIFQEYRKKGIKTGRPSDNSAIKILTNPLNAGYIEYSKWGVGLRKGHHKGIVSMELLQKSTEILRGLKGRSPRKDFSEDFPARGYVICDSCKRYFTASWNTGGSGKRYANYSCKTSGCAFQYKTINRDVLHEDIEKLLQRTRPVDEVLDLTQLVLDRVWSKKVNEFEEGSKEDLLRVNKLDSNIEGFLEKLNTTKNERMIKIYEDKVSKLDKEKELLLKNTKKNPYTKRKFGTAKNKVFEIIREPVKTWNSDDLQNKQAVLDVYFDHAIPYIPKVGLGTPHLSDGLAVLKEIESSKDSLVDILENNWNTLYEWVLSFDNLVFVVEKPLYNKLKKRFI